MNEPKIETDEEKIKAAVRQMQEMSEPTEPTLEEKKEAVQQAIRNQIESVRGIAKDMDENEARVASAILLLNTAHQFNTLSIQIEQLTRTLAQFTQPTLVGPGGAPLIH